MNINLPEFFTFTNLFLTEFFFAGGNLPGSSKNKAN